MHILKLIVPITTGALLAFSAVPAQAEECAKPKNRPFQVFNALFFSGQPDLTRYGLKPIHVANRGIWAPGISRTGPPDPALVQRYVDKLPRDGAPIVLDFEDFKLTAGAREARAGVAGLTRILQAFRSAAPDRTIGFYGYLPHRDYWRAIRPRDSSKYRSWQGENDRSAPLADRVDVLFPSIYTFYPDADGWVTYATAQICEARRLSSKPVYVFLWPEYHSNGKAGAGRVIPGSYWRQQLETARKFADGVVIWGGWDFKANKRAPWNQKADWWLETLRFMRTTKSANK